MNSSSFLAFSVFWVSRMNISPDPRTPALLGSQVDLDNN